jgi:UDP-N-acetylmuramoyl-tripeptide--D-alanyl-D-alanine ligase
MKFRVGEIAAATGGKIVAGRPETAAGEIGTDTRTLGKGQTFLAIRGERFDGHDFLEEAVRRGAACLVVDREDRLPPSVRSSAATAVVVVRDGLEALADLGGAARERLGCPVVAVTGSCGKTTVKEMIGQILSGRRKGRTPQASFNNAIGVPLTLLGAEPDDAFVLCEFGTNAPGEIARLARIGRPTVGVVTTVAPAHLEGLGSLDGVAREKAALVEAIGSGGVAILNADDPRVAAMAGRCRGRVVTVGTSETADLRIEDVIQTDRGVHFTVGGTVGFEMPVLGRHQALLAALAAAAAREVGVALEDSARALRAFRPPPMRLTLVETGVATVLNDAYNANPASMKAALDLLALWPDRRKVFFCGDMRELGAESRAAHEEIGRMAVEADVDRLVCVGPESRATAEAAKKAGLGAEAVTWVAEAAEAAALAPAMVDDGDVVLVKGSRAIGMERVAEAIGGRVAESDGGAA